LGSATWTDANGDFWLFGGSNGRQFRNDLWKFNASSFTSTSPWDVHVYTNMAGQWTFVSSTNPSSELTDQAGVYPPSANAYPGAWTNAVTWVDQSGNFWMFGGYGYDGQSPAILGFLSDLWEYTTGGQWVFVGGSTKANQLGVYGTAGTAASTNMPGGRQEAGWVDVSGNLWLFGGEGYDATSTTGNGFLNDMWRYLPYQTQ
jgi:hypothetical protein